MALLASEGRRGMAVGWVEMRSMACWRVEMGFGEPVYIGWTSGRCWLVELDWLAWDRGDCAKGVRLCCPLEKASWERAKGADGVWMRTRQLGWRAVESIILRRRGCAVCETASGNGSTDNQR